MLDASQKEQPILHIPWPLLALVVNTYPVDLLIHV